jgi:hypothetical protein
MLFHLRKLSRPHKLRTPTFLASADLIFDISVIVELAGFAPHAAAGRTTKVKVIYPGQAPLLRDIGLSFIVILQFLKEARLYGLLAPALNTDTYLMFSILSMLQLQSLIPLSLAIRACEPEMEIERTFIFIPGPHVRSPFFRSLP